ncbi:MAG: hypothetical protein AAF601_15315 [Pseudomonadota bacterium]
MSGLPKGIYVVRSTFSPPLLVIIRLGPCTSVAMMHPGTFTAV